MQALIERTVPTKLKRISVALDDEAHQRLEELANSSMRSVANMAAVLIESALFPGGRVVQPREDKRGGKREGAGRKPKADSDRPNPSTDEATEGGKDDE